MNNQTQTRPDQTGGEQVRCQWRPCLLTPPLPPPLTQPRTRAGGKFTGRIQVAVGTMYMHTGWTRRGREGPVLQYQFHRMGMSTAPEWRASWAGLTCRSVPLPPTWDASLAFARSTEREWFPGWTRSGGSGLVGVGGPSWGWRDVMGLCVGGEAPVVVAVVWAGWLADWVVRWMG